MLPGPLRTYLLLAMLAHYLATTEMEMALSVRVHRALRDSIQVVKLPGPSSFPELLSENPVGRDVRLHI